MANVRLRVVLDDGASERLPGDAVAGRVEVEVDEAVECRGVEVSVGWKVEGDANEAEGDRIPTKLPAGNWNAGDRLSLPFRLTVPAGPASYDGRRFRVVWTVFAEADLDWALDPDAEAPFAVGSRPGSAGKLVSLESAGGAHLGCAIFAVAFLLAPLAILLFAHRAPAIPLLIASAVGLLVAAFAVPNAIAHRRMGKVTLEAGPSPAPRGSEIACRVLLRPSRDVVPNEVKATLTAVETSEKGSGKQKSTHEEEIASIPVALEGPSTILAGSQSTFAGLARLPDDAAPTFEAGPHHVAWKLKVAVDIPGLPDPEWEVDIEVV